MIGAGASLGGGALLGRGGTILPEVCLVLAMVITESHKKIGSCCCDWENGCWRKRSGRLYERA